MVATAEMKPPAGAAPRKEDLDVQIMVSKQTRELKVGFLPSSSSPSDKNSTLGFRVFQNLPPPKAQVKELNDKLRSATESAKAARSQEKTLKEELQRLTSDLQASKRGQKRLQAEQKESEKEIQELKQQNSRFKSALQVRRATVPPVRITGFPTASVSSPWFILSFSLS